MYEKKPTIMLTLLNVLPLISFLFHPEQYYLYVGSGLKLPTNSLSTIFLTMLLYNNYITVLYHIVYLILTGNIHKSL
jgi:hypothetical protein